MTATRPKPATDTTLHDVEPPEGMPAAAPPAEPAADAGKPTARTEDPIGAALRRLHEKVVSEPIPDAFLALIAEIDSKIEGRK